MRALEQLINTVGSVAQEHVAVLKVVSKTAKIKTIIKQLREHRHECAMKIQQCAFGVIDHFQKCMQTKRPRGSGAKNTAYDRDNLCLNAWHLI
jgi:hypothetical protein